MEGDKERGRERRKEREQRDERGGRWEGRRER